MKKTLQRLGIVTVGLSLCLWSCKEQGGILKPEDATSISPKIKEKIDFSVVDGRLKFETDEDFIAAFSKLSSEQEVKLFESIVGFTSLNKAYQAFLSKNHEGLIPAEYADVAKIFIDNDGRKSYERALKMSSLSALVNRDGLVQIGEKVMKFSDENVKITEAKYIRELETDIQSSHVKVNNVIQSKIISKIEKGARVTDFDVDWQKTWEVYDWWHYPKPSGADRRFQSRRYARTYNQGQYYLWGVGVEICHQRDDFWGWTSCNIDGWKWPSGYVTFESNGHAGSVAQSQIQPSRSTSWYGGSSPAGKGGDANYNINIEGIFRPSGNVPQPQEELGILVHFRPGYIVGQTYGDQILTYLSFDANM